MKIRTQFIITLALFAAVLLIISASVIVTDQRAGRLHEQEELAHAIERDASDLYYLSNDYLLYRESRQRSRWISKFASLSRDLSRLSPGRPEEEVLVEDIRGSQRRLRAVFASVVSTGGRGPQPHDGSAYISFVQVSSSRMAVQNEGIIFDSVRLSQMLRNQADDLRRENIALIFALLGVFGAYLLADYLLVYRRTLSAILDLQAGTEVIGGGNLDFAVAIRREDEIGQLSHAFNRMAANLKDVTASKMELETEVSERRQAEQAAQAALDRFYLALSNMTFAALLVGEDGRIEFANQAFCDIFNLEGSPTDLKGLTSPEMLEMIRPVYSNPDEALAHIVDIVARGLLVQDEEVPMRGERTFLRDFIPIRLGGNDYGRLWIHKDITERKRAQEAVRESETKYRNLFESMTEEVHFWKLVRDEDGRIETWTLVDANPPTLKTWGKTLDEIRGKTTDEIFGPGATEHYMPVVQKIMTEGVPHSFEDYFPNLDKYFRFTSVPLGDYFITTGADITAIRKSHDALAQVYEREHRIAEILQQAIIPVQIPSTVSGCHFAARYVPALSEAQVGGDFYDVFDLGDGRVAVLIGDVAGKGVQAAMQVSSARYAFRSYAYIEPRPSRVMGLVNDALCRDPSSELGMLTAFFAVVDTTDRAIDYTSAGHEPPVVRRADGSVIEMDVGARALGILPGCDYPEGRLSLGPGDLMVLVTDGITEARSGERGMFGKPEMLRFLAGEDAPPEELVDRLLEKAKEYGNGHLQDDVAVVALGLDKSCVEVDRNG